ncbi:MAG: hypothetical protein HND47_07185 [Chloroflexi bacterium]|nr:hypothetical protein [Chloroflexota bacterium]
MYEVTLFDHDFLEMMKSIAGEGVLNAADGFSGMIGRQIRVSSPAVKLVPVLTIPQVVGKPDEDAVGVYLRFHGNLAGQIMLIIPHGKAMELADLIMGNAPGTTRQLGSLERSALGELGNLCGSFFLNTVAKLFDLGIHPSPPAVMVDMVAAILDIVVATMEGISEQALLFQANFVDGDRRVDTDFWVIPDLNSLQALAGKNLKS